jgi:hypothetical protein
MSRVRFATAKDLFEAFPELFKAIQTPPTEESPINFLNGLAAKGLLDDAIAACAFLLPRREAVWWSCASVRRLSGNIDENKAAGLRAAEAWVHEPENDRRLAALDIATKGDPNDPSTYLAFAAGWSGGLLYAHPENPVPMPTYMTPRAARTAITLATHYADASQRPGLLRTCIENGAELAVNGF